MLLIEIYMLVNQHLPLGTDYFMITLMAFMISLYTFVSLRLLYIGLRKVCFSLGKWLKNKYKKEFFKISVGAISRKNISTKRFLI